MRNNSRQIPLKNYAILVLFCLPQHIAADEDDINFFGKLSISPEYIEAAKTEMSIYIYGYLGLRGENTLSDTLNILYNISYEIESGKDNEDNFSAKDQYIGLQGSQGVLAIGRDKTLLKRSEGVVDLFNYLSADIKYLFKGQDRLSQTATYVTPNWLGTNLGVTYLSNANEEQENMNGYSIAARYGDIWLNDTLIYAAIAYDDNVKGYNIFRATFQSEVAHMIVGGMYQKQKQTYIEGIATSQPINTGYMLSFAYPIANTRLKTQFQTMERVGTSWAFGLEYALSNPIDLFLYYVDRTYDKGVEENSARKTEKYIGLNINYLF